MLRHLMTNFWLIAFALAAPFSLAVAEQGDIIISRDVQPRVATRPPLVPDPNPLVSNPGSMTRKVTTNELSDSDFASISTGLSVKNGSDSSQVGAPQINQMQPQHMPGVSSAHRAGSGGSAQNAVSGQVNRSIQQGLLPLQQLGGQ